MAPWLFVRPLGISTIAALTIAIIAVSSSAPLTVYAAAPALAIAFYRNAGSIAVIGPASLTRRNRVQLAGLLRGEGRRTGLVCVLAGVTLAAHFGTWLPSTKLTTVANATALVATQPVWAAIISVIRRIPVATSTWIGMAVAVTGVVLATGADFTTSGHAVAGDLLAVFGAAMAAIYTTFGERARMTINTTTYTLLCYSTCAVTLLIVDVCAGVRMNGYTVRTWGAILGLVIGAQLLGHSMINFSLRRVSATAVAILLLLEVPGSIVLGWVMLGQVPAARSVPGLAIGVIGVAITVIGSASAANTASAAPAAVDSPLPAESLEVNTSTIT